MLELRQTKKGWGGNSSSSSYNNNMRSRSKSRERVSLLGKNNNNGQAPPNSANFGRLRNRGEQEMVSLLGTPGKTRKNDFYDRRTKGNKRDAWTKSRMMKYAAVLLISAILSFKMTRKGSQIMHWEEWNDILDPQGVRCFEESRGRSKGKAPPCLCLDPTKAVANDKVERWLSNHDQMVHQAINAPKDLDIVFFGDGMVEQLSGTRELMGEEVQGMGDYFARTFTKRGRGQFNAIAIGSSGDTGPNLLWHWENGIQQAKLRPKMWFIMVGTNDLYVNKCNDQFVMANVLNVAKRIFEDQPDAKIVLHGIIPRKDDVDAKSNDLGDAWNRAQGINVDVRKFIKTHSSRIFYMNFGQTLMTGAGNLKFRKAIDPKLISGKYPTSKGMEKWGDLAVKKLVPILNGFDMKEHRKKTKKPEIGRAHV